MPAEENWSKRDSTKRSAFGESTCTTQQHKQTTEKQQHDKKEDTHTHKKKEKRKEGTTTRASLHFRARNHHHLINNIHLHQTHGTCRIAPRPAGIAKNKRNDKHNDAAQRLFNLTKHMVSKLARPAASLPKQTASITWSCQPPPEGPGGGSITSAGTGRFTRSS